MTGLIAAEWLKVRSVRSTFAVLGALVVALLIGTLMSYLMTADWDGSVPAEQATFPGADPGMLAVPFAQFCLAAFGGLVITSEFATGLIQTSVAAVPQRLRLLTAKIIVIAALALATGLAIAFSSLLLSRLITGDRPAPITAWESVAAGLPTALASGLSIMVIGLVGLGIGAVVRSTAAALVIVSTLLLVLPAMTTLLPSPWGGRISAVMLPSLAGQLAGAQEDTVMSPYGALAVMAAYVAAALGAGALSLLRRDV
ncbi:ABC transporter permease [Actinomadura sp. HBU206391]|uniref:ABC transporter permease n=1 Tax=Actinomadura sp. HBU206391 TaxID=2731692 RepID=UPI0016504113|nr:ABC transporter permease [Actinomadura sp. HBU206391]MBC6457870.1 ABC transporter permease [Actinomadura sp. HBU206391]